MYEPRSIALQVVSAERGMRRILVAASLALLSLAAGCHNRAGVGYPASYVERNGPTRLWVTPVDGSELLFNGPGVHGDTLTGFVNGRFVELPLSQVKFVEATELAPAQTAALASAGAMAAVALVVALTTAPKSGGSNTFCEGENPGEVVAC